MKVLTEEEYDAFTETYNAWLQNIRKPAEKKAKQLRCKASKEATLEGKSKYLKEAQVVLQKSSSTRPHIPANLY